MKRFTVPCEFGDTRHPFHVYISNPGEGFHPLQWQARWLLRERDGVVPDDVMASFAKLKQISKENNVSFEDLCVYALGHAAEEEAKKALDADAQQALERAVGRTELTRINFGALVTKWVNVPIAAA